MAASRKPGSGPSGVAPLLESGTLVRCQPAIPGPVAHSDLHATDGPKGTRDARPAASAGRWIDLVLEESFADAAASAAPPGFIRIARSDEPDAGCRRLSFKTPAAVRDAAERLAEHPVSLALLRDESGVTGARLVAWVARRLQLGELKILWRRREQLFVSEAAPEAPRPAPPRRVAAAAPATVPTPTYSTFPADLDAAAVAGSLRDAASDGVPFCEECMKAQAANDGAPAGGA